jgi:hypothetical protein
MRGCCFCMSPSGMDVMGIAARPAAVVAPARELERPAPLTPADRTLPGLTTLAPADRTPGGVRAPVPGRSRARRAHHAPHDARSGSPRTRRARVRHAAGDCSGVSFSEHPADPANPWAHALSGAAQADPRNGACSLTHRGLNGRRGLPSPTAAPISCARERTRAALPLVPRPRPSHRPVAPTEETR